jgi:transposase
MEKSNKFSPEVRERAVRMVQEQRGEYPSLWAPIESIAPKIGCVPQTLNEWVKRAEVDAGTREGVTTAEAQRVKELEREVKELRPAPGQRDTEARQRVFRPGGARPPSEVLKTFIDQHRNAFGIEPLCKVL